MYECIDCISSYGNNRLIKFDISPIGCCYLMLAAHTSWLI
jgi:hypothetical protein